MDSRFSKLQTDPRFVRPKRQQNRIALDDRFKDLLEKDASTSLKTDKYGRTISKSASAKELKKFYHASNGNEESEPQQHSGKPDPLAYARGEILMESSDEEDSESEEGEARAALDSSDEEGSVELGPSAKGRQYARQDSEDDVEVDLDEDDYAPAMKALQAEEDAQEDISPTKRIAIVNLDWDHVRAIDIYKVFASVLSVDAPDASKLPPAPLTFDKSALPKKAATRIARGRIVNVSIFPSQFGKERLAREEKEGPPQEIFAQEADEALEEDDIDEANVLQPDEGEEFNQKALRRYQLERLR